MMADAIASAFYLFANRKFYGRITEIIAQLRHNKKRETQ